VPANQSIANWINAAAFAVPANDTWGNAGRNLIRGPGFVQLDMGLTKTFRVTERVTTDFRAEAFNVANRAQFGDPNGNFSSPSFGKSPPPSTTDRPPAAARRESFSSRLG
jgi:hypothetical protein